MCVLERRDYLELMTGQIRCRKMCPVIAREVEDHIEDQSRLYGRRDDGRRS